MVGFSYIHILQGNVATQLRFGEIFSNYLICELSRKECALYSKKFGNRLIFDEDIWLASKL